MLQIPSGRTLSVGTVARLTGYHVSTIRRALQRGDLQGYRAGRRGMYRVELASLERWLRPAHDQHEEG